MTKPWSVEIIFLESRFRVKILVWAVTELSFAHVTIKLGIFRCLAFQKKMLVLKSAPPPAKSLFDSLMENPFSYFFNTDRKAPNFF